MTPPRKMGVIAVLLSLLLLGESRQGEASITRNSCYEPTKIKNPKGRTIAFIRGGGDGSSTEDINDHQKHRHLLRSSIQEEGDVTQLINAKATEENDAITTCCADEKKDEKEREEELWRMNLPTQLQKRRGSLHRILIAAGNTNNSHNRPITCELYLLGTAHVSKDSCADAKLLMQHVKPDVLFVELCGQRISILEEEEKEEHDHQHGMTTNISSEEDGNNHNHSNGKKKSVSQMTKEIMISNPDMSKTAAMSSVLLSKIQGDYAEKLGVKIGGEFQEAYQVARKQHKDYLHKIEMFRAGIPLEQIRRYGDNSNIYNNGQNHTNDNIHGCAVVLGDRPVRLTLLRTWESLSFFGKIKLVCGLLWSSLQQPDEKELKEWIESIMNDPNNDLLTKSIEELSQHFPTVKQTIIAERDTYMACKLLQTSRVLGQASVQDGIVRRIVAIVGAGHLQGIRKLLDHDEYSNNNLACAAGATINIENIEEALKSVIETRKMKIDGCPEMASLINDVESIEII